MASQQWGCPASVWDLRQVIKAVWLKLPSLRSWGKSLGDRRLRPINIWKYLHLRPSQHMTSPIRGHIIYRSAGSWDGAAALSPQWGLLGGVFPLGTALLLLPSPQSCKAMASLPLWSVSGSQTKKQLTCLLYLASSHRLETRPFHCAANLWETRAVQRKRLWDLSFMFDTRPGRFGCILVWLSLS